ncbi:RNA-binding protein NOB1 [Gryllus bimaculatus]|nr:RNA-binding protein NOB1 [Gryllus bimaculatus]
MPAARKVEHLVVDTTAFIKNANIQDLASNVYTVQGVVDEITNKRQLRRLVVLPYDLIIKDVFTENIKFVTEFSKKTGDYSSLSAVDIQVLALAYQLEKEHVGVAHLKTEPTVQRVDKLSQKLDASYLAIAGFYMPPRKNKEELPEGEQSGAIISDDEDKQTDPGQDKEEDLESDVVIIEGGKPPSLACAPTMRLEDATIIDPKRVPEVDTVTEQKVPEVAEQEIDSEFMREVLHQDRQIQTEEEETQAVRDLEEALRKTEMMKEVPAAAASSAESAEEEAARATTDEEDSEEDEDAWDDSAWITPDNVEQAKQDLKAAQHLCICVLEQNVIKQLGMKVLAADGRIIKEMRTHILRCYSCFKTTSKMELHFCPHCGNKTLRRAAVLLKPDGTEEVQISFRKAPTGRGKRFSLPTPKGGKHAVNPILCPDQRIPQQHATQLACAKNNPLEPDYIAGYSPFVLRDVTSRSAMLGIRSNHTQIKNWMRRNPNEVVKKGKKRK